jgi:hypothetical protein
MPVNERSLDIFAFLVWEIGRADVRLITVDKNVAMEARRGTAYSARAWAAIRAMDMAAFAWQRAAEKKEIAAAAQVSREICLYYCLSCSEVRALSRRLSEGAAGYSIACWSVYCNGAMRKHGPIAIDFSRKQFVTRGEF